MGCEFGLEREARVGSFERLRMRIGWEGAVIGFLNRCVLALKISPLRDRRSGRLAAAARARSTSSLVVFDVTQRGKAW
jgi:hypothetical protein